MSFDALTISAIIVSLAVVALLIGLVHRMMQQTEAKLRNVAKQSVLLTEDQRIRALCAQLRKLYPDACPGLDYVLDQDPATHEPYIREWHLKTPPPPEQQLKSTDPNS